MRLNDTEVNTILNELKLNLGTKNLVNELGMIIKHLPTYNKIVKSHIAQLQNVLALDNHNNQNIESINLSPTVKQLMKIFEQLEEDDLEQLEQLYFAACNWQTKQTSQNINQISEVTL